ncbi:hypothetical protein XM38_015660 [Halomicronema hongdechloris C2206]|uniref:NfeD-like C-terminal domain-containing protein n=1 Tax=Halomicronema hongdechloris C2206 TaxID=1641165 RepID=A0A1Z3HK38_9CYAN|nr:NfeD family protein [Halomicronema hongdechloris]ASC70626.1 hypothetical protein XM38_015660 [Halomicronema hongdechloris C2206]
MLSNLLYKPFTCQPANGHSYQSDAHFPTSSASLPLQDIYDESNHQAVVTETIRPGRPGHVKYQATWWKARCPGNVTVESGARVHVLGRQGLTLIVAPLACRCGRD